MSITNLTNLQVGMADLGIGENDKLNRAQMPKRSSNASGSSSEFSLSDVSSLGASPTGSSTSGFSKREDWETINLIKDESFAKVLLHHLKEAGKLDADKDCRVLKRTRGTFKRCHPSVLLLVYCMFHTVRFCVSIVLSNYPILTVYY
jgi:hypothetical protein